MAVMKMGSYRRRLEIKFIHQLKSGSTFHFFGGQHSISFSVFRFLLHLIEVLSKISKTCSEGLWPVRNEKECQGKEKVPMHYLKRLHVGTFWISPFVAVIKN